jgi:hypothetical protein
MDVHVDVLEGAEPHVFVLAAQNRLFDTQMSTPKPAA